MPISRYPIGRLDDLDDQQGRAFRFTHEGREIEGFLVNHMGDLFAYLNRCVHTPMRLDGREPGVYFDPDGRRLRCQSHGATFRPDTGECLAGPPGCAGKHLSFLTLAVDGEELYVLVHEREGTR